MQATNLSARPALAPEARTSSIERMPELLSKYPAIADEERLELIEFLKEGHPDELAKVVYGKNLGSKAVQVKKDHPDHFGRGLRGWLPLLIILALSGAVFLLGSLF